MNKKCEICGKEYYCRQNRAFCSERCRQKYNRMMKKFREKIIKNLK